MGARVAPKELVHSPSLLLEVIYLNHFKIFLIVCLSGDITDAKLEDREGSRQFEDEWKQYDQALCESGILDKTIWLDTRGNHGLSL